MRDMHAYRREPLICILSWMITRAMEVRAIDDHLMAPSVSLTTASSSESSAAPSSGPSDVPTSGPSAVPASESSAALSSGPSAAPAYLFDIGAHTSFVNRELAAWIEQQAKGDTKYAGCKRAITHVSLAGASQTSAVLGSVVFDLTFLNEVT